MGKIKLHKLFEPGQIGRMKLKNRLVCAPMLMNYATEEGFVTSRILGFYEALARGGVGLIIAEGTCPEAPRGRTRDYQLVLDDDRFIPGFKELAHLVHQYDTKLAIQLMHVGPNGDPRITHMQLVGPSTVSSTGLNSVRELDISEIKDIVAKFANAAERAKRAGLDGIEIHAGHSYLVAQFLSSATNKRPDIYGGSLENRARFPLEIFQAVREAVGEEFPVWCRINGKEYDTVNGLTVEESQSIAVMLEKAGADAVVVTTGGKGQYAGYSSGVMYDPPGNLVHLAEAIKRKVNIPVIAVGKLDAELAEKVLQEGKADLVAMARGLLADADLPNKAAEGRLEDIRPCIWCRTCGDTYLQDKRSPVRCEVNASLGFEREYQLNAAAIKKSVLIIGGGPAGMEAARVAAARGHEVLLYEKKPTLGGQLALAAKVPFKTPMQDFIYYLSTQLKKLKVNVVLGTEATSSLVEALTPDVVIIATGAISLMPDIPGLNQSNAVTAEAVLMDETVIGQEVVIIGGGVVGCDIADYLSERGKQVTIIEMLPRVVTNLGVRMRSRILHRLSEKKVKIKANAKCFEIKGHDVIYFDSDNQIKTIDADTIVLAAGSRVNRELSETIGRLAHENYLIGDCVEPRHILESVADGFRIGQQI